jgi:Na+/H+ antiporter NhaD/arsenite permease-like protein
VAGLYLTYCPLAAVADEAAVGEAALTAMRQQLPLLTTLPFMLLLLAIAILPLLAGHWWERNRNKALVVVALAAPVVLYLTSVWADAGQAVLLEKLAEYASFIILLASLYVISGGIYLQGSLSGTPLGNTGLLALGAVLANVIGTTGASVLMVRPLLRANAAREDKTHIVVFFIFVVSNCGGLLTPLGDPPLFLGFLKGVPFEWTLRLWPQWLLINLSLLVIFHIWDEVVLGREERRRPGSQYEQVLEHEPLRVQGLLNVLFLLGIVATIFAAGRGLGNGGQSWPFGVQEAVMALLGIAAFLTTPSANHTRNRFTFGPIIEVAVLFAGIFVTMAPALAILNAWGQGQRTVAGLAFGLREPWQFFWVTGVLSSFLDNAPTYLTFAVTACGLRGVADEGRFLDTFLQQGPEAARLLAAIACGAVMMGANTYIGNGPNFMVKAIAEENGVRMPSFFGYMLYSGAILLPLFVVVTLVFFRG